jgi:ribA/ribD-fused uncharacterized protein
MQSNDIDSLRHRVRTGEKLTYFLFWGHHAAHHDRVDSACLSQWWPAPFVVDGHLYPTAEHFMMVAKARLFGDVEAERAMLAEPSPLKVKRLGRLVRGFREDAWERVRFDVVVAASVEKFRQHVHLGRFLAATGDMVLVEASPTDRVWGIGLDAADPAARDPLRWRGLNLLGFALMEARARLQEA